ncbi:hypothetical protein Nepgr_000881 [Nepenthes gracilis]|uniref:Uncharacterized protein n=1 Tax=Nepenthes gracilis TaxID=150966 RepID=A0AAD3RVR3_NEPGR|nr:hypothetical protein Nepgr_000881 [Nepenthes gracilis]
MKNASRFKSPLLGAAILRRKELHVGRFALPLTCLALPLGALLCRERSFATWCAFSLEMDGSIAETCQPHDLGLYVARKLPGTETTLKLVDARSICLINCPMTSEDLLNWVCDYLEGDVHLSPDEWIDRNYDYFDFLNPNMRNTSLQLQGSC